MNTYRKLPGHVLVEDFIVPAFPADLHDLSNEARIPLWKLRAIIRGNSKIDKKTAKSLGAFFQNGADYWTDLQTRYDKGEEL